MNDEKMREQVHRGIDRRCASLSSDPYRVQRVLRAAQSEGGKNVTRRIPRMLAVWMVLLVLGVSTALAAGVISWHRGLEDMLRVTEDTREYYQALGLFDAPGMSVTQNGVTVTLEQSIVDTNAAYFAFRVKGYQPPEGKQPAFASVDYAADMEGVITNASASFFNGLVSNGEGRAVYLDGSIPEDVSAVPYTDENGEMVYTISLLADGSSLVGRTMRVTLTDLGVYADKWGTHEVQAPGTWTFEWTLQGTEHYWDFSALNLKIGDSGAKVTQVHLSPIHIQMSMEVGLTLSEYEQLEGGNARNPYFFGVKLKDGTRYEALTEAGAEGYATADPEGRAYQLMYMLNRVIEPAHVDSFLFSCPDGSGETEIVEVPFNQM